MPIFQQHDVWVVAKDPGGINTVLPVLGQLCVSGLSCLLISDGFAACQSTPVAVDLCIPPSLEVLMESRPLPKALVTSMCSGGGFGRDLVPLLREQGIPTFAIQDYWGSELHDAWESECYRPDYIMVNDEVARSVVCQAWPEYQPQHVLTTGSPAFDKYAGVDVYACEEKVRSVLELNEDIPIVLFAGQGDGSGATLHELVRALKVQPFQSYLIPRPHPRMDIDFRDELPQWHEALAEFGHSTGLHVVDWLKFNKLTPLELIAACAPCGVVASMFSTVLAEAACLRAKTISILYPEIGQWAFSRAAPYLPTQAYEVALGCARIARSPQELEAAVYSALRASRVESLATRARQAHFFNNKGGNAEITASIICELAALT